ncbi:NCS1 family nucleobase:cation symporter-1 [Mesorhizobium soli]|uniref:purine-cytosine permease family protein n=1 Tax=Pseudaminobacter soli (ex Li et al. 2025) TaxID=1295366 RepID=UPI002476A896|nr:cytosine permease [Mesorhizobium soli]MDH6233757.1 NCS1 family nucleobase:cation symporter-1 [Mesorhizobium soli]
MNAAAAHDADTAPRGGVIEAYSIDYIPRSARHGKAWHQGPFWFTGNFVISTMIVGFAGPAQGLSLGWSILASSLGAVLGTFFMAFHANQGPAMGLPQMIQSRAQFGMRGAIIPLFAVLFVYIGFSVFGLMLVTQVINLALPGSHAVWYPAIIASSSFLAIAGHDLLHAVMRRLIYLVVPIFLIVTAIAVATLHANTEQGVGSFTMSLFLMQFAAAAGYQISYAVYVSDYTRYLPAETSSRALIGWTFLGAALSSIWLMSLGSLIASAVVVSDAVVSMREVGDTLFKGFGTFVVVTSVVPSSIAIIGVNAYGSMLAGITIAEGFRDLRPTAATRVVGIGIYALAVLFIAFSISGDFLNNFTNFFTIMLYVLIPWTAINLADFYVVRRGHYAIADIFNPDGIYGRWGWQGIAAYAAGFVAMVPFMSTAFYVGPVARQIGGADLAFLIGLIVGGVVYLFLMRGYDRHAEDAAIERSAKLLDGAAS